MRYNRLALIGHIDRNPLYASQSGVPVYSRHGAIANVRAGSLPRNPLNMRLTRDVGL